MKLFGLIMLTVLLQVTLPAVSQTVSISVKNLPLKDIFAVIKTQTGVFFFYDAALLQGTKPVTIELKNVPLQTALNEIFKGQPLTWALEDRTVTVIKRLAPVTAPHKVALQRPSPHLVKGSISDGKGNPIAGVSVLIKDTKRGTVSDDVGGFLIEADQKNVLIFSSLNYTGKEVKVEKDAMNIQLQLNVKPMEKLLVDGNLNAIKRKADPNSVTILDSKTLEKIPANMLDQVFRGWVPGTNSFDIGDAPEGFPSLSIRGAAGPASLSKIAVYIDGIEYAGGSGYLSQLDINNIDRIEIVRGPGAATLYGTGSNGGIIQIFTKKGRTGQTSVNFTTGAGFYKSKWVKTDPFQQMHTLETVTGFKNVSLTLGGSYRTVDAYLPDGGEKNKGFYIGARFNIGKFQANFTGRYNVRNFHISRPPYYDTATHPRTDIFIETSPGMKTPAYQWFNVRPTASRNKDALTETYITGINLSHRTTENWVNNLDAGYTNNTNSEVPMQDGRIPLQTQYLSDQSKIITIRYSNVLTVNNSHDGLAAVITTGAEYKKYSAARTFTRASATTTAIIKDPDNENYGAFAQFNPSYKRVYLTLGLRYEKNNLFKPALNPRVGITTNFETRSLTIKPRISWGKGISSPTYQQRFGRPPLLTTVIYANSELKAQSQQGFDYGLEIYGKKDMFKFEVVLYDNTLKDMIAQEGLGPDPGNAALTGFKYANVGTVANRGWEFSGEYKMRRFSLQGTFSIMNATIDDTTGAYHFSRYSGKAPGTRLIYLPRHTAGLNLNYNFYKLFGKADKGVVSFSITEVDGIKAFDALNYALDVAYGRAIYIRGGNYYEVENTAVFRVGVYADYSITPDLRFFIQGSNILNSYKYEFYNDYPTHGATWLFGLKYHFSERK